MIFAKEIEAIEEIKKLKEEHNLAAEEVFVLQILKFVEMNGLKYNDLKEYFIKNPLKSDNKGVRVESKS